MITMSKDENEILRGKIFPRQSIDLCFLEDGLGSGCIKGPLYNEAPKIRVWQCEGSNLNSEVRPPYA